METYNLLFYKINFNTRLFLLLAIKKNCYIIILIVDYTCSEKKKIENAPTRLLTSRGRTSLSINGLHGRHINRLKSDYRGIECVVAYQFDFKGLWRQLHLSPFSEFDSNKEDVLSPGVCKPFRGD